VRGVCASTSARLGTATRDDLSMETRTLQDSVMARLGEFPTERQLNVALGRLIGQASAMRTLVSLDADLLTDDDLVGQVGHLLLALAEAACVLGVDLTRATEWAASAATTRVCDVYDERLVSARETP
jgi:hypothetical protein